MEKAIVYIPPDDPHGEWHALEGLSYLRRRGYKFYAIMRRLDIALSLLDEGRVNVVRFPPVSGRLGRPESDAGGDLRRSHGCYSASARLLNSHRSPSKELREASATTGTMYETARLLPRGDDGGFAEDFLSSRAAARDT